MRLLFKFTDTGAKDYSPGSYPALPIPRERELVTLLQKGRQEVHKVTGLTYDYGKGLVIIRLVSVERWLARTKAAEEQAYKQLEAQELTLLQEVLRQVPEETPIAQHQKESRQRVKQRKSIDSKL